MTDERGADAYSDISLDDIQDQNLFDMRTDSIVGDAMIHGDGCVGGAASLLPVTIDRAHLSVDLSAAHERLECCSDHFCCEASEGLAYVELDPVGNGDWQIQALSNLCCSGPRLAALIRTNEEGRVLWMRTTCSSNEFGLAGSRLVDSIPLAGGHLAVYEIPAASENEYQPTPSKLELRYIDAAGQIVWTRSGEDIGNVELLVALNRNPGNQAKFIATSRGRSYFLSVSIEGDVVLIPLSTDFGAVSAAIPDLPGDSAVPLLLSKVVSDSQNFTLTYSFALVGSDGTVGDIKNIGTWKGQFGVTGSETQIVEPSGAGYLIIISDNSTNKYNIVLIDGTGETLWEYNGVVDSEEWPYCNRTSLFLKNDAEILVFGNRDRSLTNKSPYVGTLTVNGGKLDFQISDDLRMPYAGSAGWYLDWARQVGDRWLVKGSVPESGDGTTSNNDTVLAIYDSEFRLIHAYNYGLPGSEHANLAEQDGAWVMTLTRTIPGLQCLIDQSINDATTTFMTFDKICD